MKVMTAHHRIIQMKQSTGWSNTWYIN